MTENKPDCYQCKWRRPLAGSAHSSCAHPNYAPAANDSLAQAMAIFASVGRTAPQQADCKLNVKGNPRGIRMGWFNWPWSFDPTWLISCDGFDPRVRGGKEGEQ
uniref:Uncharacterized protein n=1 Tax=viral metagenome TaxID=1070528 RepID=A0A6H1ZVD5_9ZZZZ